MAEIIYDITFYFTQHYLQKGDRTIDQMVQAARSGKQNIAEGNQAAATSSETEIKLTNVAKASLEELLDDYEDYLRVRGLEQWGKLHPRYEKMRQYARSEHLKKDYSQSIQKMNDEEIATSASPSSTRLYICCISCSSLCRTDLSPKGESRSGCTRQG